MGSSECVPRENERTCCDGSSISGAGLDSGSASAGFDSGVASKTSLSRDSRLVQASDLPHARDTTVAANIAAGLGAFLACGFCISVVFGWRFGCDDGTDGDDSL